MITLNKHQEKLTWKDLSWKKIKAYTKFKFLQKIGVLDEKNIIAYSEMIVYKSILCAECVADGACLKSKGGCGCFDDKTEVLTDQGWKFWPEVTGKEMFLSTDPSSGKVEYVKARNLIKYHYQGHLDKIKSNTFSLLTTPNHLHYVKSKKTGKYSLQYLKDILSKNTQKIDFVNVQPAVWEGNSPEYKKIGTKEIPFDIYCKFMGWFLSDGHFKKDKRPNASDVVEITQHKSKNKKEIRAVMKIFFGKINKNDTYTNARVKGDESLFFQQFGKTSDKYVPEDIRNAKVEHIEIFLDSFFKGDGSTYTGPNRIPRKKFHTASTYLRDDLCELILKTGNRPSVVTRPPRWATHHNGRYKSKTDNYDVHINSRKISNVDACKITKEHYDGMVYDVFLEKYHTLYVRREGKVTISGNCPVPSLFTDPANEDGKGKWPGFEGDDWPEQWAKYKKDNNFILSIEKFD